MSDDFQVPIGIRHITPDYIDGKRIGPQRETSKRKRRKKVLCVYCQEKETETGWSCGCNFTPEERERHDPR